MVAPPPPAVLPYAGRIEGSGSPMAPATRVLVLCSIGGLILLIALGLLLPPFWYSHTLSNRTVCAANMSGIGKGLLTYANDGNQGMPIAAHWPEQVAVATGQVNYVGRIGSKRGVDNQPNAGETWAVDGPDGREMSTTRNLWTLVRSNGSTAGSFICPDAGDVKNGEDNPQDYWDSETVTLRRPAPSRPPRTRRRTRRSATAIRCRMVVTAGPARMATREWSWRRTKGRTASRPKQVARPRRRCFPRSPTPNPALKTGVPGTHPTTAASAVGQAGKRPVRRQPRRLVHLAVGGRPRRQHLHPVAVRRRGQTRRSSSETRRPGIRPISRRWPTPTG